MSVQYIPRHQTSSYLFAACFWVAMLTTAPSLHAQIPWLDTPPWAAAADSVPRRAFWFHLDRFDDEMVDWSANRVGLTGLLPAGERGLFFVRFHYLALSTDERRALERWPELAGEDAGSDWPQERRIVGFDRPEVGLLRGLRLPWLGSGLFGLTLGLPIGRDELYPLSSASMPLRLDYRRNVHLNRDWWLSLEAGRVFHFDSAREFLDPAAFPGGARYGGGLIWRRGPVRHLEIFFTAENLEGRRNQWLTARWLIPSAGEHAFGLIVQRELSGSADRPLGTRISLIWQLRGQQAGEMESLR